MKKLLSILALLMLSSCGEGRSEWQMEYHPTTPEEREAVAKQIARMLNSNPSTAVAVLDRPGFSPDQAYQVACMTICRPTLWEYVQDHTWAFVKTGRFKYANELPAVTR